jgi:hypothetical protein
MNLLGDGTDGEGNADEAKTGEGGGGPYPGQCLHFIFQFRSLKIRQPKQRHY